MLFSHSPQLLDQFPQLSVTALSVTGITAAPMSPTHPPVPGAGHGSAVATRIQPDGPETHPIPVCVGALLRRFRKDGLLPSIHPLVDVCNAVSLAYTIPIAMANRRAIKCSLAHPVYERPSARRAATRVRISAPKLSTATRTRMIRLLLPSHRPVNTRPQGRLLQRRARKLDADQRTMFRRLGR